MGKKLNDTEPEEMKFRELLDELESLNKRISDEVKKIYDRRNSVQAEAVKRFFDRINRRKEKVSGLLTSVQEVRFRDGARFQLKPHYMSADGAFRNNVWKSAGPEVFTIKRIDDNYPF